MLPDIEKIKKHAEQVDHESKPEGGGVARVVNSHATENDTKSHTNVPASELGRVGGTSFVVGGEVDEHGLHAWSDVTIPQTDDDVLSKSSRYSTNRSHCEIVGARQPTAHFRFRLTHQLGKVFLRHTSFHFLPLKKLAVKIVVAALTAFLTALGTTSCMRMM